MEPTPPPACTDCKMYADYLFESVRGDSTLWAVVEAYKTDKTTGIVHQILENGTGLGVNISRFGNDDESSTEGLAVRISYLPLYFHHHDTGVFGPRVNHFIPLSTIAKIRRNPREEHFSSKTLEFLGEWSRAANRQSVSVWPVATVTNGSSCLTCSQLANQVLSGTWNIQEADGTVYRTNSDDTFTASDGKETVTIALDDVEQVRVGKALFEGRIEAMLHRLSPLVYRIMQGCNRMPAPPPPPPGAPYPPDGAGAASCPSAAYPPGAAGAASNPSAAYPPGAAAAAPPLPPPGAPYPPPGVSYPPGAAAAAPPLPPDPPKTPPS